MEAVESSDDILKAREGKARSPSRARKASLWKAENVSTGQRQGILMVLLTGDN